MENKLSIFEYLDYRNFLKKIIKFNDSKYGYKAALAEAAGCQRSFLSQVLAESTHLSAEHGLGLTKFWEFSGSERDYFLNLILFARAGNKELQHFYREKIESARADQENLVKRIEEKVVLPEESAAQFYSNWQFLAITILLTIAEYRTTSAIARRLDLREDVVKKSLQQLEQMKIVVNTGGSWLATQNTIHVPRDSQFNSLNHSNWRARAVQDSFLADPQSVHYTSVCSVSLADAEKLKALVFQLIDESRKIIAPSPEEELFCLTTDWFKV